MQAGKFGQKIVEQELALDSYLQTLLDEIPNDNSDDLIDKKELKTQIIDEKNVAQVKPGLPVDNKLNERLKNKASKNFVNSLAIMPEWAQHEFQALFFKVDALILAVPLVELLRTIKIEAEPTKIPGQPSWVIGLLDVLDQRITVLDTGQLIFGKTRGKQRDLELHPFKSILITHDGLWGLACDELLSIGRLTPDKVRWRTLREKRPWLMGTVIDELTAIIDVNQLTPHRT